MVFFFGLGGDCGRGGVGKKVGVSLKGSWYPRIDFFPLIVSGESDFSAFPLFSLFWLSEPASQIDPQIPILYVYPTPKLPTLPWRFYPPPPPHPPSISKTHNNLGICVSPVSSHYGFSRGGCCCYCFPLGMLWSYYIPYIGLIL